MHETYIGSLSALILSRRRGLLTNAGHLQLPLVYVMRQSRHKSVVTATGYIEDSDAWRNNITEPVFRWPSSG